MTYPHSIARHPKEALPKNFIENKNISRWLGYKLTYKQKVTHKPHYSIQQPCLKSIPIAQIKQQRALFSSSIINYYEKMFTFVAKYKKRSGSYQR